MLFGALGFRVLIRDLSGFLEGIYKGTTRFQTLLEGAGDLASRL